MTKYFYEGKEKQKKKKIIIENMLVFTIFFLSHNVLKSFYVVVIEKCVQAWSAILSWCEESSPEFLARLPV